MKKIALLLLWSLMLCSCASWPGKRYTDVRGYADPTTKFPELYDTRPDGSRRFKEIVTAKTGIPLTPQQAQRLTAAVTGKHPSHPHAACFRPRHEFVFFDGPLTPGAHVSVCFECLNVYGTPKGLARDMDFPALAELCSELHLPASPGRDFRKGFEEFRNPAGRTKPVVPPIPVPQ